MSTLDEKLSGPFIALGDLIHLHATQQPAHPAMVQGDQVVDYAALDTWMDRIAASLQRSGIGARGVIAISARNSLEFGAMFLGAARAGVAVAPLAPDTTPDGIARMVADSGAQALFVDEGVAASLKGVAGSIKVPWITLDGSGAGRPLADWLMPPGARPTPVPVGPDWTFNIIYSSGTTGAPKGIAQPHSFRWAQLSTFRPLGYGPDAVTLVSIPLYSNMTLSSFLPALAMGGTVVLMAKFDAGQYLQLAERHRVTHSIMVPVQLQRLMAHPDFDKYDLSSFRFKGAGSAPFPAPLKADILARWPGTLIEFYGMTEGGGVCTLDGRKHPDKLHTVGHPTPDSDMRVIDDDGRELPPGSVGEIVSRSGTMMIGYHNLPEKTAEFEWFDAQGRRFFRSGDVGRFDEDGFLTLMDRKKDMVISGGFNVYPSDLEAILAQHPQVLESAVFGVPSERWGETPVAHVVARAGAALQPQELLAWLNAQVGKSQRLATLEVVAALPRSDIGKVLKRQLRDQWVTKGIAL